MDLVEFEGFRDLPVRWGLEDKVYIDMLVHTEVGTYIFGYVNVTLNQKMEHLLRSFRNTMETWAMMKELKSPSQFMHETLIR